MNMVLGLLTGVIIGWVTYANLGASPGISRKTALLIGAFAASVPTQFQPIFDPSGTGTALQMFGFALAAVSGSASVLVLNFVARQISRA